MTHRRRGIKASGALFVWVALALAATTLSAGLAAHLLWLAVLLGGSAVFFAVQALRARQRGVEARRDATAAEDQAWLHAALAVTARAPGGLSAGELATALEITETEADRLLTALAVHERARVDVQDDGTVRFVRTRVATDEDELALSDEAAAADGFPLEARRGTP